MMSAVPRAQSSRDSSRPPRSQVKCRPPDRSGSEDFAPCSRAPLRTTSFFARRSMGSPCTGNPRRSARHRRTRGAASLRTSPARRARTGGAAETRPRCDHSQTRLRRWDRGRRDGPLVAALSACHERASRGVRTALRRQWRHRHRFFGAGNMTFDACIDAMGRALARHQLGAFA